MKKLVILGSFLLVMSFAAQASADELRTYYNQKVPYSAFFQKRAPVQTKVQAQVNGQTVQAVVPTHVVNTKEDDKTQPKKDK